MGDPISPSDTLLSVFSTSTTFGRSLAYTALYEGLVILNSSSFPLNVISQELTLYHFPRPSSQTTAVRVTVFLNYACLTVSIVSETPPSSQLLNACETSSASPTLLFMWVSLIVRVLSFDLQHHLKNARPLETTDQLDPQGRQFQSPVWLGLETQAIWAP
jgi:hypothetical protein